MFIWTLWVNLCRVQVHYGTVLLFFHCLFNTKLRKTLGQKSSHNSIQHRPSSKRPIAVLFEDRAEQRLRMCIDRRGLGTKQRSFAKGFSKQRHILAFLRWQTMMSWTCAVHYSALPYSRSTEVSAPRILGKNCWERA